MILKWLRDRRQKKERTRTEEYKPKHDADMQRSDFNRVHREELSHSLIRVISDLAYKHAIPSWFLNVITGTLRNPAISEGVIS